MRIFENTSSFASFQLGEVGVLAGENRCFVRAANRKRPTIDRALGEAVDLRLGLGVDLLVDPRNRHAKRWPHFQQRFGKMLHERTVGQGNAVIEQRKSTWRAVTCESGRKETLICPGPTLKPCREQAMFEAMLPCVSIAPFDVPVVPEV